MENIDQIYDKEHCGVIMLKNFLPDDIHKQISDYLSNENNKTKYIKLPYMYGKTIQDMSVWNFASENKEINILKNKYLEIRNSIFRKYDIDLEICVNYYDKGAKGISPHRDFSTSVNMIGIYVVHSKNDFCVADTRDKQNEKRFDAYDNTLIIMRGPRSTDENDMRPFHYVENIIEDRISIIFRENKTEF